MKVKTYPDMKDSGVPWIGEIPECWETIRLKFLLEGGLRNGLFKKKDQFGRGTKLVNVSDLYSGDFYINDDTLERVETTPKEVEMFGVHGGDLFFVRSSLKLEGIAIAACAKESEETRVFECHLVGGRPHKNRVNSRFVTYYLHSRTIRDRLISLAQTTTMTTISQDKIGGLPVLVPKLEEQHAIASYLDRKTAAIDSIIEKKQRLLTLLEEKRAALINHAVTKGLNPDVPMKDSGVPWIGEIPEHWRVMKLGYLGQLQNGLNIGGDSFGSGDPFISYGDVYNNAILPSNPVGLVRSSVNDQMKYSLRVGDVLFTRTSETIDDIGIASTCLQEISKVTFAGFLIRFRPLPGNLAPSFSSFLFRNQNIQGYFARNVNLVTRASLSQDILKTLPICLPPLNEQIQIAAHLSKMALAFEQLDRFLVRQVELLKERRQALITAAVTGKIDVCGEEA